MSRAGERAAARTLVQAARRALETEDAYPDARTRERAQVLATLALVYATLANGEDR